MQEVLSPTPDGEYMGKAVVQEVFNIGGTGHIAGSRCFDGALQKVATCVSCGATRFCAKPRLGRSEPLRYVCVFL